MIFLKKDKKLVTKPVGGDDAGNFLDGNKKRGVWYEAHICDGGTYDIFEYEYAKRRVWSPFWEDYSTKVKLSSSHVKAVCDKDEAVSTLQSLEEKELANFFNKQSAKITEDQQQAYRRRFYAKLPSRHYNNGNRGPNLN